ncbi:hypothetical protein DM01DRAFT_1125384 [Hesseltinella vesiculosa]|uniref:Uncharacterized protein n=1 Tax=Hesseltinella vesiculosa TaxID=101127 RepID=A0A1X2GU95_9FUNG|nr:hypothetical protein DM01DRAFT_1125384 [Hesseltinella vesiculosa]
MFFFGCRNRPINRRARKGNPSAFFFSAACFFLLRLIPLFFFFPLSMQRHVLQDLDVATSLFESLTPAAESEPMSNETKRMLLSVAKLKRHLPTHGQDVIKVNYTERARLGNFCRAGTHMAIFILIVDNVRSL